ncbi:uncharacterized protein [Diadema antillarum]|uniref:uncharacterized protein n=1 Tax=Diadema antillarum TaxID=105358 RepID=UPI003A8AA146
MAFHATGSLKFFDITLVWFAFILFPFLPKILYFTVKEPPLVWGLCVPESCSNSDVFSSLNYFIELVEAPFNMSILNGTAALCAGDPPEAYNTGFIITVCLIAVLSILAIMGAVVDKTLKSRTTKTAPPSTTDTAPPSTTNTAPPSTTNTAPPSTTDTTPPSTTDTAPPSTTDTAPPSTTDTAPPSTTNMTPPSTTNTQRWVEVVQDTPEEIPTGKKPITDCTKAWHQFFFSFAINRNLSKLMKAATSEGSINCLNGIRVISMAWVILGHLVTYVLQTNTVGNLMYGYSQVGKLGFQILNSAFFSLDSLFFCR